MLIYLSSSGTGANRPAKYLLASILTVSPESLKVDWICDFKSMPSSETSVYSTDLEALEMTMRNDDESIYKSCRCLELLILRISCYFMLVTMFLGINFSDKIITDAYHDRSRTSVCALVFNDIARRRMIIT